MCGVWTRQLLIFDSLHRFLERISRHPTLQRSTLVRAFFESTEWVRRFSVVQTPLTPSSTFICINISHTLQGQNLHQDSSITSQTPSSTRLHAYASQMNAFSTCANLSINSRMGLSSASASGTAFVVAQTVSLPYNSAREYLRLNEVAVSLLAKI
jgi:hypothetical protein